MNDPSTRPLDPRHRQLGLLVGVTGEDCGPDRLALLGFGDGLAALLVDHHRAFLELTRKHPGVTSFTVASQPVEYLPWQGLGGNEDDVTTPAGMVAHTFHADEVATVERLATREAFVRAHPDPADVETLDTRIRFLPTGFALEFGERLSEVLPYAWLYQGVLQHATGPVVDEHFAVLSDLDLEAALRMLEGTLTPDMGPDRRPMRRLRVHRDHLSTLLEHEDRAIRTRAVALLGQTTEPRQGRSR